MDNSTVFNVENLKTGDIVLFSGTCLVSRIVRGFTRSKWSHIGMVIIDPSHPIPLIYESSHGTALNCRDIECQTAGVQLLFLRDRIATFKGDMVVRRLQDCVLSRGDLSALSCLRKVMVGTPFEESVWQMMASDIKTRLIPRREDLSSVFCSELTALCYRAMGLLGQVPPSNMYSPADFSAGRNLPLLRGSLGPQIKLKLYRR